MNKKRLGDILCDPQQRPVVACLSTAVIYSLWRSFGEPRYYLEHLSQQVSLLGDTLIDAELYRGTGHALLVVALVAIIKLCYRETMTDFGLAVGRWRNAPIILAATPLMLLFGYIGASKPEYREFYPATPGLADRSMSVFLLHAGFLLTNYIAWEMLFRGFLQKSLIPHLGAAGAIAAQTLASTLAHMDRPVSELFGSIGAGIVWGTLAYRTGSIWPCVLQHMLLGLTVDYLITFGGLG